MNSSSTEIKFNKEQANYGIEELRQCQKELYEADKLFYKGIMALASARGMDLILKEDAGINLYMPEKIVIECREEVANLIEEISSKIALVEEFNEVPKEETVQYRKAEVIEDTVRTEVEPVSRKIVVPYTPGIEDPEIGGPITVPGPVQALYAPPGITDPEIGGPITVPGPIQALYAPPGAEIGPIEGTPIVQPMYGVVTPEQPIVNPVVQPMYGVVTPEQPIVNPVVQPMYGVVTPEQPIVNPVVQPMYGVVTPEQPIVSPIVQPMYGVVTPEQPIVNPVVQPMYGVVTPDIGTGTDPMPVTPPIGIDPVVGTPEYETIPNTGIPGVIEKNYVSKHPRLIGGLAATIGLFGIPTMLSDDYDEIEEKRINGKED
ncbi:MAG: hypothetical protein IJ463_05990 [Bacilli bacterium]|nr:hypothetical protein [Bacilli bacterium]